MKKYTIKFEKYFLKVLKKLDKQTLLIVTSYIDNNLKDTNNLRKKGKALTENLKGLWRYRIMDYRLIVDIQDDVLVIVAIDFRHRNKICKQKIKITVCLDCDFYQRYGIIKYIIVLLDRQIRL